MKKNDFILIGILLAVILIIWVPLKFSQNTETEAGTVLVTIDGKIYASYSMNEERTETITLEDGSYNVLEIKNGEADITSASCPDQYCVEHRKVSRNNESIVCLPNKLVVTIESSKESEVDGTTN